MKPDFRIPARNPFIVVAAHNQWDATLTLLRSLRDTHVYLPVVLVDDGSTDETATVESFPGVALFPVHLQGGSGLTASWNLGIQVALKRNADAVIITHNASVVEDWASIYGLVDNLSHKVGVTGTLGGVLDPNTMTPVRETRSTEDAHYVLGNCMAIHRDVFKDIGLFDEVFQSPYHAADIDFCIKSKVAGWRLKVIAAKPPKHAAIPEAQPRDTEVLRERYAGYLDIDTTRKLLVRRYQAAGDLVMATSAIHSLRRQHPYAQIDLDCAQYCIPLVRYIRDIDHIGTWLNDSDYDKVYMLDGSYERRGTGQTHPPTAFAEDMGVALSYRQYRVFTGPEERAWAHQILRENPYSGKTVIVGLRSAGRPLSNWAADRWLELIQSMQGTRFILTDVHPHPVAFGTRREGADIYDLPNVLDLTGKTPDLLHVTALLELADACITVDTAVLHLANAAGCPTVALMGGRSWHSRRWVSDNVPCTPIEGWAHCYPCNEMCDCPMDVHCLDHITTEIVREALEKILDVNT